MNWRRFFAGVDKPAKPPEQLADGAQKFFLADFAALRPSGQTVLFIRPRRALSNEEEKNIATFISNMRWPPGVTCVCVPHDFEILAAGEAELKKLGWAKIEGLSDG